MLVVGCWMFSLRFMGSMRDSIGEFSPRPSPRGEGASFAASWKVVRQDQANAPRHNNRRPRTVPSPGGEGQDEGEPQTILVFAPGAKPVLYLPKTTENLNACSFLDLNLMSCSVGI